MLNRPKLLLDENLSWRVARGLAAAGYEVTTPEDAALVGKPDGVVFAFARQSAYILVTRDSDFLSRFAPPHAGISVVRCPPQASNALILNCLLAELPRMLGGTLTDAVRTLAC